MSELVLYETDGRVAKITINRPEKRNALNQGVCEGLAAAFERYAHSEELCAVLTGMGDAAFSAGVDFHDAPTEFWKAVPGYEYPTDKPLIAAVSGHCMGGAFVLPLHCDMIVASESARFTFPEGKVGLLGGAAAAVATRMPPKIAAQFVMMGEAMDARRAYEVGLVNKVVPVGQQVATAMAWAGQVASMAPLVVRGAKALIGHVLGQTSYEAYLPTMRVLEKIRNSEDRREGAQAWREKRAPVFKGR